MVEKLRDADEWWAGLAPEQRAFFRDLMRYADDLLEGDVLKVTYDGRGFVLRGWLRRAIQPNGAGGRLGPMAPGADEWWARLSSEGRRFLRNIDGFVLEVARHRDEFLEIINNGEGIQATLVMTIERPIDAGVPERN